MMRTVTPPSEPQEPRNVARIRRQQMIGGARDPDVLRPRLPLDVALAQQLTSTIVLLEELVEALVAATPVDARYWAESRDVAWLRPLVAVGFELQSFTTGKVDAWRRADAARRLYETLTTYDGDSELAIRYRALRFRHDAVLTRHMRLVSAVMRLEALARRAIRR